MSPWKGLSISPIVAFDISSNIIVYILPNSVPTIVPTIFPYINFSSSITASSESSDQHPMVSLLPGLVLPHHSRSIIPQLHSSIKYLWRWQYIIQLSCIQVVQSLRICSVGDTLDPKQLYKQSPHSVLCPSGC